MAAAPLLLVVGPTASGKSSIAEGLAARIGAEIVSADALQVYRGLDIGTAKPGPTVRASIPHHGVDLFEPTDRCTAGRYARWARPVIRDVIGRGRPCLLVGGSGFYVRATLEGLDRMPTTDPEWRSALELVAERRGTVALHAALERLDPEWAGRIDEHDRQRLVRALEVVLRTGRRLADQPSSGGLEIRPSAEWLVQRPRTSLYERIDARVDRMMEAGWLDEVRALREAGVPLDAHGLQAIGYRELVAVLEGDLDAARARERIRRATRRYAKRQISWFRRRRTLEAIEPEGREPEDLLDELERRLAAAGGSGPAG